MASEKHNIDLLARDLVRLLADLTGLHTEMALHMRDKFEAMRQADAERIQAITARELLLAEKAGQREGLRRQITRRILEGLGVPRAQADSIRLSALAELLPEPRRSQLLTAATGLRTVVTELRRLQQTNALVTGEMLKHLRSVVAVMCGGSESESYSRGGRREQRGSASVFEAVG